MDEKKVNLDKVIQKQFPASMFPGADEQTMVQLYRAYSCGFKDGYGMNHVGAIINMGSKPTLGELLYAAQQERLEDS